MLSFVDATIGDEQLSDMIGDFMKFAGFGQILFIGLFAIVGILLIRTGLKGNNFKSNNLNGNNKDITQTNMLVYAKVTGIAPTGTIIMGRGTYKIYAMWADEYGNYHNFESKHLYSVPVNKPEEVKVYVEPSNYSNYYMDTDFESY